MSIDKQTYTYIIDDEDTVNVHSPVVTYDENDPDGLPFGLNLKGDTNDLTWISKSQASDLVKVILSELVDANMAEIVKLREDVNALSEDTPFERILRDVSAPAEDDQTPFQVGATEGRDFTSPLSAADVPMEEWNEGALGYAIEHGSDVTFQYQGERDEFPRQRVVLPAALVGRSYNDEQTADAIEAYDVDENVDGTIKRYRLDRIKSHVLVLGEEVSA